MKFKPLILVAFAVGALTLSACRARAEPITLGIVGITAVGVVGFLLGDWWCHKADQTSSGALKYRRSSTSGDAQCAAKFKSYDAGTGLYTAPGNVKKPCPFLN